MGLLRLKLFIAGGSSRAEQAVANLRAICRGRSLLPCDVTVIDVLDSPEAAEAHKIIATPTLLKEYPYPQKRIIGDLSDVQAILKLLNLAGTEEDAPRPASP